MRNTVLALFLSLSIVACAPAPQGAPHSAHDADGDHDKDDDGDHDDHDGALPELPTGVETMVAAQKLSVRPNALDCQTEILGLVDVHERSGSEEQALQKLRIRAVQIGAEALTNVEYRHGEQGEKLHLSATAVRCHDLLRGRRYQVLAKLDIVKPMGQEEEALAELRARGRSAGANVILDVRFEHGDASNLHLTGKAVRALDP